MKQKTINSQLTNYKTYLHYRKNMLRLATNVLNIKNVPKFIDLAYVNKILLQNGSIVWFYDDVLDTLMALPYVNLAGLDVYYRPYRVQAIGANGATYNLKPEEFVIMYDNTLREPLMPDIVNTAERLAMCRRICDINIVQQKTPRVWQVPKGMEKSFKDAINEIDAMQDLIVGYDGLGLENVNLCLEPAPFVADKIEEYRVKLWSEFLAEIGISSVSYQKKERLISDEVTYSLGGTVCFRQDRFTPRQDAIEEINEKFKDILTKPLEVEFYDGLPTTLREVEREVMGNDIQQLSVLSNNTETKQDATGAL